MNIASLLESVIAEAIADPNELIPTEKLPSAVKIIARIEELESALQLAILEYEQLPHSLGYEFTHLPKMRKALGGK